jgi:anti-sigma-K factor RskA
MTEPTSDQGDPNALAGEHALGLLTGEDRRQAIERAASDPEFARELARWRGRLAPLAETIVPVDPPDGLWPAVESGIDGANVVVLRRRVKLWRAATAGMGALAASLALFLVVQSQSVQAPQPATAPMVAMLGDREAMKVVASWDPGTRQLVLAVPADMPADPAHAHELWVIPPGGEPRSLGTMPAGKQMHMRLADALAELLQQGATIAISVEPPGGSPTGAPTGPMIASGALSRA